jgi:hypothetical protein
LSTPRQAKGPSSASERLKWATKQTNRFKEYLNASKIHDKSMDDMNILI